MERQIQGPTVKLGKILNKVLTTKSDMGSPYLSPYLSSNTTLLFFLPFPKQQILDSSKLKEFADNNFKCDENGRKFSKQVENAVGKGEIALYEKFLLSPQCTPDT